MNERKMKGEESARAQCELGPWVGRYRNHCALLALSPLLSRVLSFRGVMSPSSPSLLSALQLLLQPQRCHRQPEYHTMAVAPLCRQSQGQTSVAKVGFRLRREAPRKHTNTNSTRPGQHNKKKKKKREIHTRTNNNEEKKEKQKWWWCLAAASSSCHLHQQLLLLLLDVQRQQGARTLCVHAFC